MSFPRPAVLIIPHEEKLALPLADFNMHYAGMDMAALGYFQQADMDGNPAVFALEMTKTYTPHSNIETENTGGGNTTETIFLGRLAEFRGGQFTNFVIFDKKRIAVLDNGRTRWVHIDPQGSANFFSDENGTKIAQIAYYPYGNERSRTGSMVLRTFAMHDYDDEIGLIYMGHRWYAPEIG